jgi:hypothetical protein
MAMSNNLAEQPLPTCLKNGIDPLLLRLRAVFGDGGRADIAPELAAARAKRWENAYIRDAYIRDASCNGGTDGVAKEVAR